MQSCDTVVKCPIAQLTLCRRITTESDSQLYIHCGPYLTIARNSYAHAHGYEFRGGNFKHFKTSVECPR